MFRMIVTMRVSTLGYLQYTYVQALQSCKDHLTAYSLNCTSNPASVWGRCSVMLSH